MHDDNDNIYKEYKFCERYSVRWEIKSIAI